MSIAAAISPLIVRETGNLSIIITHRLRRRLPIKLFNLSEDPYEKNDLSKTNQQKAKELFRLMVQRLEKEQALYPVDADKNVLSPIFVAE